MIYTKKIIKDRLEKIRPNALPRPDRISRYLIKRGGDYIFDCIGKMQRKVNYESILIFATSYMFAFSP